MENDSARGDSAVLKTTKDSSTGSVHLTHIGRRDALEMLQKSVKEKVMLAGSLVVQQVSQIAVLEYERAKLASLKLRATRLGVTPDAGRAVTTRDVATQTEDESQRLLEEMAHLKQRRGELLAVTRNIPRNTATMVELLKKRNAMLLARQERSLQQAVAAREDKEERVKQLQERLAQVQRVQQVYQMQQVHRGGI